MLDEKAIKIIEEIVARGHTAEVRKRKNEIVIIEISGKLKHSIIVNE